MSPRRQHRGADRFAVQIEVESSSESVDNTTATLAKASPRSPSHGPALEPPALMTARGEERLDIKSGLLTPATPKGLSMNRLTSGRLTSGLGDEDSYSSFRSFRSPDGRYVAVQSRVDVQYSAPAPAALEPHHAPHHVAFSDAGSHGAHPDSRRSSLSTDAPEPMPDPAAGKAQLQVDAAFRRSFTPGTRHRPSVTFEGGAGDGSVVRMGRSSLRNPPLMSSPGRPSPQRKPRVLQPSAIDVVTVAYAVDEDPAVSVLRGDLSRAELIGQDSRSLRRPCGDEPEGFVPRPGRSLFQAPDRRCEEPHATLSAEDRQARAMREAAAAKLPISAFDLIPSYQDLRQKAVMREEEARERRDAEAEAAAEKLDDFARQALATRPPSLPTERTANPGLSRRDSLARLTTHSRQLLASLPQRDSGEGYLRRPSRLSVCISDPPAADGLLPRRPSYVPLDASIRARALSIQDTDRLEPVDTRRTANARRRRSGLDDLDRLRADVAAHTHDLQRIRDPDDPTKDPEWAAVGGYALLGVACHQRDVQQQDAFRAACAKIEADEEAARDAVAIHFSRWLRRRVLFPFRTFHDGHVQPLQRHMRTHERRYGTGLSTTFAAFRVSRGGSVADVTPVASPRIPKAPELESRREAGLLFVAVLRCIASQQDQVGAPDVLEAADDPPKPGKAVKWRPHP